MHHCISAFLLHLLIENSELGLVEENIKTQANQVFKNLKKVADAAGIDFDAIVKLNVYLTDISQLSVINEVMMQYFKQPYPARTSVEVAALPKGAAVEIEAVAVAY